MLYSCELKVNAPGNTKNTSSAKIRNGIDVNAKGVKVEQPFLTYDNGSLVDETNTTSVNKKIKINFAVKGWKAENDEVALEANEKVTTSEGNVIMDEQDYFQKED